MKATFIALLAVLLCVGAVGADKKPLTKAESAKVIEAAIRKWLKKPTGELTKADWEKVTFFGVYNNHVTDVTALEKLTQLTSLNLNHNQLIKLPMGLKMTCSRPTRRYTGHLNQ